MKGAFWAMILLVAGLAVVAYRREPHLPLQGLKDGGLMIYETLPLLIVGFIFAGMIRAVLPMEVISKWLGTEAGFKGIMIGCVAGAISPGGPFINFPIVAALYKGGAGVGAVVGFVTAWALWPGTRMIWEIAILGPKLSVIRLVSTVFFPPLAGMIAHFFFSKVA